MLQLRRREGESVTIETPEGRLITLHVFTCQGGRVTLGVEADRDVAIYRPETAHQYAPGARRQGDAQG